MKTTLITIEFANKAEFDQKILVMESKGYKWNYAVHHNDGETLSVTFYCTDSSQNILNI